MKSKINKEGLVKAAKVVGICGATTCVLSVGYKLGYAVSDYKFQKGLAIVFEANPELKEKFVKTITEVAAKKMMDLN